MRKKRTATKTGSSFVLAAAAAIALCWPAGLAGAKKDKKEATAPFALVAGTVYRPPGFALPGADVSVTPEQPESNGIKLKKAKLTTDARGEWTLRVPPVPATWRVDVKVKGYRPEQRSVSVEGEQRLDLSIVLEPAGNPEEATR